MDAYPQVVGMPLHTGCGESAAAADDGCSAAGADRVDGAPARRCPTPQGVGAGVHGAGLRPVGRSGEALCGASPAATRSLRSLAAYRLHHAQAPQPAHHLGQVGSALASMAQGCARWDIPVKLHAGQAPQLPVRCAHWRRTDCTTLRRRNRRITSARWGRRWRPWRRAAPGGAFRRSSMRGKPRSYPFAALTGGVPTAPRSGAASGASPRPGGYGRAPGC